MSWRAEQLTVRLPGAARPILHEVAVDVPAGTFLAIVGPNGAGKSTLLSVLTGVRAPTTGRATFEGRPVTEWPRRALAQRVGVVPQHEELPFPLTVREYVAMGRYPHQSAWAAESADDAAAVAEALRRTDVEPLAHRYMQTLSGGERQRARIARALAQRPVAFALDEPSAALDMAHEMAIFELMRAEADAGRTVVLVTHHLNLAARYADRLLLLHDGVVRATGVARDVLVPAVIEHVFGWPVVIAAHPGAGPDLGTPQVVPLAPTPRTL